jgi:sterol 3beta-glucosyltransferase
VITILTLGSRGDVEPYVALGRGLTDAGYPVRIATLAPFEEFVRSYGLEFRSISDPLAQFKTSPGWVNWQKSGVSWWRKTGGLHRVLRKARPALLRTFDECMTACDGSAAVLGPWTGLPGKHIADHLGVFHAFTLLQPVTPTCEYPHFLWPWPDGGARAINQATYPLVEIVSRALFAGALREWRRRNSLRPLRRRSPVIYAFSGAVLPRPRDWPPDVHVTGYWLLNPDADWEPPEELARFLNDGTDVACVCHGRTFRPAEQTAIFEIIRRGVESADHRMLLVSPGGGITPVSPKSLVVNSAPFDWLFQRVRLVLHHGGAGTSAAVLRAGRPSIVLPTCFDQPFWASVLRRLGATPDPLRPHLLTHSAVENAVREASGNPRYGRNAMRCAARLAAENGVESAVAILRRYLPAV